MPAVYPHPLGVPHLWGGRRDAYSRWPKQIERDDKVLVAVLAADTTDHKETIVFIEVQPSVQPAVQPSVQR